MSKKFPDVRLKPLLTWTRRWTHSLTIYRGPPFRSLRQVPLLVFPMNTPVVSKTTIDRRQRQHLHPDTFAFRRTLLLCSVLYRLVLHIRPSYGLPTFVGLSYVKKQRWLKLSFLAYLNLVNSSSLRMCITFFDITHLALTYLFSAELTHSTKITFFSVFSIRNPSEMSTLGLLQLAGIGKESTRFLTTPKLALTLDLPPFKWRVENMQNGKKLDFKVSNEKTLRWSFPNNNFQRQRYWHVFRKHMWTCEEIFEIDPYLHISIILKSCHMIQLANFNLFS